MNWNTTCANHAVTTAYDAYRDFLFNIATLYAGTRLIEAIDLSPLGADYKLAISDDFPDGYTTIRTVGQLEASVKDGQYGQLALSLATVQLCTAFEIFLDRVADIYSVSVSQADSFNVHHHLASGGTMIIGNKALMQIRKIHTANGINSPLNSDEVLIKIAAIIEVRNCVTHAGGVVVTQKVKDRLWAYRISSTVGKAIVLKDNNLDDFLHYMAINVLAFVNRAPCTSITYIDP